MGQLGDLKRPLGERSYRAIWVSLVCSELGDWAARLALAVLVLERTRSPLLAAMVTALSFLPWMGPGQALATRMGHLKRTRVMIAADLVRAGIFALMLLPIPPAALLGMAFAAALATPPFEASRSALTVEVVSQKHYGDAMALNSMTQQVGVVVGYLVGGLTVAAGGARVALAINAASFLVSALAISTVREPARRSAPSSSATQLRQGLSILRGDPLLRRGILLLAGAALPAVAVEASAAAYARIQLHDSPLVAGILAMAVPAAVLGLTPFVPRSGDPTRLLRGASTIGLASSACALVAFAAGHLAGGLLGFAAAGGIFAMSTPAQVAFQPRIPRDRRPAVISLAQGSVMGAQALGAILGGVLASAWSPRLAGLVAMAAAFCFTAGSLLKPAGRPAAKPAETLGATSRNTPAESNGSAGSGLPAGPAGSGDSPNVATPAPAPADAGAGDMPALE